ncbi:MAG: hypothetical protein OXB88_10545 [Bacteriovoracales bacterium]|nr:hypothetical protein [Bacteriovoracales bacterium]
MRRKKRLAFIFSLSFGLVGPGGLHAHEVDHFSNYAASASLMDSREQLNRSINERMTQVLEKLPSECDEKRLYRMLKKQFTSGFKLKGWTRKEIVLNDKLDKLSYPLEGSIYENYIPIKFIRIIGAPTLLIQPLLSRIFRIGDVYLGTDKIGHFFTFGFKSFKTHYLKNKPLRKAFLLSWKSENSFFGARTTRIISYGDLLANFNGMRFWNHILQKEDDLLGENLGPYIDCQDNRWVQVKSIDWGDYIDHGFDESINCSRFKKEKNKIKIQTNIKKVLKKQNLDFKSLCPLIDEGRVTSEHLLELEEKYGDFAPYVLNFYGHSSLKDELKNSLHPSPFLMD